jgi:deoxyhypusine monooxygenase
MAKEDAPRVVRESCVVAIDMWEVSTRISGSILRLSDDLMQYENSGEFQYANGLTAHQAEATPMTSVS